MWHLTGKWSGRLVSRCLFLMYLLCLGATAQGVERIRYYVNDPSGSPIMVLDADGAVVARYAYAPLGSQMPASPTLARQRLSFVGGLRETPGLHYLKHRYYNSQLGRFYQPDPVGFLDKGFSQINRYGYGLNDPYAYRDKDGRDVYQLPSDVWSDLRLSGSDLLSYQWLKEAFAGIITPEDSNRLSDTFLQSYVEGQKNFIRSGGLVLLVIPGDELFVASTVDKFSRAPMGLMDQMVLDAAKQGRGVRIIENLGDSRFKGMEKWSYTEKSDGGLRSEVHYVRDPKTGELMDFKFKHNADTGR